MHMKQTLSHRIFNQEIKSRPQAVESLINYLRVTEQTDQLFDFLSMTARHEEAAVVKLKQSLNTRNAESKKKAISNCNMNHFSSSMGPSRDLLNFWSELLTNEVVLLERQIPLEEQDKRRQTLPTLEDNAKFIDIPRSSVLNQSVISTLFYCCLYHYVLPETSTISPLSLQKTFELTDKQFTWTALIALCKRKQWNQVDNLFQGKSWLGTKKIKSDINFDEVCLVLLKHDAPTDYVSKYAMLIDDLETRLDFAKEHNLPIRLK